MATTAFLPPADVYEDENHVTLKLEIPDIDEKDLDIRVENNSLVTGRSNNIQADYDKVRKKGYRRQRQSRIAFELIH